MLPQLEDLVGEEKEGLLFRPGLGFDISNNLGNAKSLVTHPASTTHASIGAEERRKIGIGDGLIRLSVGIEDIEDLKADIEQALG